jgi:hypothetical protein
MSLNKVILVRNHFKGFVLTVKKYSERNGTSLNLILNVSLEEKTP